MNTKLPIEKIRYIFFDIYGTLAGFYPEREKIQRKILSDNKIYLSNDQISFGYKFADEYMADQKKIKPLRNLTQNQKKDFLKAEKIYLDVLRIDSSCFVTFFNLGLINLNFWT